MVKNRRIFVGLVATTLFSSISVLFILCVVLDTQTGSTSERLIHDAPKIAEHHVSHHQEQSDRLEQRFSKQSENKQPVDERRNINILFWTQFHGSRNKKHWWFFEEDPIEVKCGEECTCIFTSNKT